MVLSSNVQDPIWTIEEGLNLIRAVQPLVHHAGYHVGLAGGVLNNGQSAKDLDIIIMPMGRDGKDRSLDKVWRAFNFVGVDEIQSKQHSGYPIEHGRVLYRGYKNNRQIDLFVYEVENDVPMDPYAPLKASMGERIIAAMDVLRGLRS